MSTLRRPFTPAMLLGALIALPAAAQQPPAPAPAAAVTVGAAPLPAAKQGAAVIVGTAQGPATRGGIDVGQGDWQFGYHGYFRAPMRIGIGARELRPGQSANDFSKTTLHLPLVPDDQYLSWQKTNHEMTDWAELYFSVGNPYARGTVAIEGYNFSQGSSSLPTQQFGVSQGYVEIMPELPWENLRFKWKVGAGWNKYGMAGRYDAGEYDTYLFGRTKGMGETMRLEVDVSDMTLAFEHGISAKQPDPKVFNTGRFTLLNHAHAFLEVGGLTVGVHALHAWAQEEDRDGTGIGSTGAGNVVTNRDAYLAQFGVLHPGTFGNFRLPDGSETVMGGEVKYDSGPYGLLYLGFAHMHAHDALTVAPAMEWLHSDGGGEFNLGVTNNYLDNPRCNAAVGNRNATDPTVSSPFCSSQGTGNVESLLFQYELSVANLLQGMENGTTFWGEGMDLVAKLYAMYNKVSSRYNPALDLAAEVDAAGRPVDNYSHIGKLKFGTDLFWSAAAVGGLGLRIDRVQPNSKLSEQSFTVLSPRLEFRSRWITRETITIQYTRYMYAQRQCNIRNPYDPAAPQNSGAFSGVAVDQRCVQPPGGPRQPVGWGSISQNTDPNLRGQPVAGGNPNQVRPDVNVITVAAEMWW